MKPKKKMKTKILRLDLRRNGSKLKYKLAKTEEHGNTKKTSCFPVTRRLSCNLKFSGGSTLRVEQAGDINRVR